MNGRWGKARTGRWTRALLGPGEAPEVRVVTYPFAQPGLRRRILPFALVAVVAEVSLVATDGTLRAVPAVLSACLLVLTAALVALPWSTIPSIFQMSVPLVYVGSLLALVVSPPTVNAGFGPVLLIPLVWTALYHRRRDAYVVVGAVIPFEVVNALVYPGATVSEVVRRTVSWFALSALLTVAIHALRTRHRRAINDEQDLRLQTSSLVNLAKDLTVMSEPDEVLRAGTKALAELGIRTSAIPVRAQYFEVHDDQVVVRIEFDPAGQRIGRSWPLVEQPWLADVIATGRPRTGRIPLHRAGPTVKEVVGELELTHGIWIPVVVTGSVRGVLALATRGSEASIRLMELACAIGNLIELALGNAITHQSLREQAITDPLTGLVNRRGFEQIVGASPLGTGFAVVVVDLDNLKRINDTRGHETGDMLLVSVSSALRAVVRHGDVVARMGGDEFAAMLGNVNEENAVRTAERMVAAVGAIRVEGLVPSISVGVAWSNSDPELALRSADSAMYRSKRLGGAQWTLASEVPGALEVPDPPGVELDVAVSR